MNEYLDKSISYSEYTALIDQLVAEGRTTGPTQSESLVHFTKLNAHRMHRLAKTIALDDEVIEAARANLINQTWLIITEAWCGDAAQNIPVIEKIAAESDIIETNYVLRDENPELIDRFLTNKARSIPKLVALESKTFDVIWTWGARPAEAQELFESLLADNMPKVEILEYMQRWYNDDRGRSIGRDFTQFLTGVGGRKTAGAANNR